MNPNDIYDHIDELEALADKHGLMLSTELINFADDVWAMATQAERQTDGLADASKEDDEVRIYLKSLTNVRKG